MSRAKIYNRIDVDARTITAGQPTEEQLCGIAAEGVGIVINLAPHTGPTALPDEAALVMSLGMQYVHIPVVWTSPTDENLDTFMAAMDSLPDSGRVLIHCAANYRVTAFYSLWAQRRLGWTRERAEDFRDDIWEGSDYPVWNEFVARKTLAHPGPNDLAKEL